MSGPSVWSFSTIVPLFLVRRSVTLICQPSLARVAKKCTVIVSPACMMSGDLVAPSVSIALKAACSLPLRSPSFSP